MTNDVFFLGAGFSKAIDNNYPTLKDLTLEINRNYVAEKESVTKHLHDEISKFYKDDIEKLLTFLYSNLPYKSEVQVSSDEALYKDITNKIANYFNRKMQQTNIQECLNKTQSLIEYILRSRCTCITLNYDTLLEMLLHTYALQRYRSIEFNNLYNAPLTDLTAQGGLSFFAVEGPEPIPRKELPDIIKLHGSLNWGTISNSSDMVYYIDENEEEYKKSHLLTYIVPPVLDKTHSYSNHVIKAIWRRAFEKLKDADNIYIYGFSFPPTDLSIIFLFQSALSNNYKTPNIYVINTLEAKNSIISRYQEIFKGYDVNFNYCCDNSLELFIENIIKPKLLTLPIKNPKFSRQRVQTIKNIVKNLTPIEKDFLHKLKYIQSWNIEPIDQQRPEYIADYFRKNYPEYTVDDSFIQILKDLDSKCCTFIFSKETLDSINDDDNIITKLGEDVLTYLFDIEVETNVTK